MSIAADYHDILNRVVSWPPEQRQALAEDILASVKATSSLQKSPRKTLNRALGLLKSSNPPPGDEEVERILEEARTERYGG